MDPANQTSRTTFIKNLYLYLVSFVALMMIVFSVAEVINITLRTYIFTKADKDFYAYPKAVCEPAAPTSTTGAPGRGEMPCLSQEENEKQMAENRSAQRQRDLVRDISMILVGVPLFAYHWHLARKKEREN